jgi:hypothetical protein
LFLGYQQVLKIAILVKIMSCYCWIQPIPPKKIRTLLIPNGMLKKTKILREFLPFIEGIDHSDRKMNQKSHLHLSK